MHKDSIRRQVATPSGQFHAVLLYPAKTNGTPPVEGYAMEVYRVRDMRADGTPRKNRKPWYQGWEYRGEYKATQMLDATIEHLRSGKLTPA
jgi:hypothetical protein